MDFTDALLEAYGLVEDIAAVRRQFSYIPEEDFDKIIRLDPTFDENRDSVGKYGKWLLSLYKKDNPLDFPNEAVGVTTIISIYDKIKNDKTKKIEKDISKFKSVRAMFDAIENIEDAELSDRQKLRLRRANDNYDKVFENDDWTIYVPNTWEAEVNLGSGTEWCTADSREEYGKVYYDKYLTQGGKYYILINKHDNDAKYQFHFESQQFMDCHDDAIDLGDFFNENAGVEKFFSSLGYDTSDYIHDPGTLIREYFLGDNLATCLSWPQLSTLYQVIVKDPYGENLYTYGTLLDLCAGVYDNEDILDILDSTLESIFRDHFKYEVNPEVLAAYETDNDTEISEADFKEIFKEALASCILDEIDVSDINDQFSSGIQTISPDYSTEVTISTEALVTEAENSVVLEDTPINDIDDIVYYLKDSVIFGAASSQNVKEVLDDMDDDDFLIGYFALQEYQYDLESLNLDSIILDIFGRSYTHGDFKKTMNELIKEQYGVENLIKYK